MLGAEILQPLLKASWLIVKDKSIALVPMFIVPTFVTACIVGQFTATSSITGTEEPVAAISLPGGVDLGAQGNTESMSALVLIMEPRAGQFAIPWKSGSLRRYWTSLDQKLLSLNSHKLRLGPDRLEGEFPLFGVGQPVVMVVEGVSAERLSFAGREQSLNIKDLRVHSEVSRSIALAGFLVSMFSLGLILRPTDENWNESHES